MRAMILAAGLGMRLRPLTEYRAKPALPVRGRPVISLLLQFLARHGIHDVMINLHHLWLRSCNFLNLVMLFKKMRLL